MISKQILVLSAVATLASSLSLPLRRQDVGIYTTFQIDGSCDGGKKSAIEQAHKDALMFANEALDIDHDELSTLLKYKINWNAQAAIEYFGPPDRNRPFQEHILRTLVLASQASRGWGVSDWWNDRYVDIRCDDKDNLCGKSSPGYTLQRDGQKYPLINYCDTFFNNLTSHDEMWKKMKDDNELKKNVRNLRSQATTAFHELLHINSKYTSNVCAGGCVDTPQYLNNGKDKVLTYKAGRAKLLARRDNAQAASMTNDNYAYYVMSRWIEKQTGKYPAFPTAWDPSKSLKENQDLEDKEPGAKANEFQIDDSSNGEEGPTIEDELLGADVYPEWYRPVIEALNKGEEPKEVAFEDNSGSQEKVNNVTADSVVCETTEQSPLYFDCVHAFQANFNRDQLVQNGTKDGGHWATYVQTCAVNIHYLEDWTNCKATMGDVIDHAQSIFHKCTLTGIKDPSGGGRCGGHVPFNVPNCKADIEFKHTNVTEKPAGGFPGDGTITRNKARSMVFNL